MKLMKQQQKGACVHLGSKCFFAILHTWFVCTSFISTEQTPLQRGLSLYRD